jgi:hypothetical protein
VLQRYLTAGNWWVFRQFGLIQRSKNVHTGRKVFGEFALTEPRLLLGRALGQPKTGVLGVF